MDYIKDDIVVVNEDGAEVKLFPSTVDEQVYVQDGINGPTTLDVELELLRNKKHELSLLDYSIKREAFIENPNPQVNSSSFNPQTSVNYTIELGCVHDGSIYGFALWDWTITENDTSFEINIINQQTNEVSRTLLTGRNAYSALGISFENYSLTTNAKGQYADQGFYIFIALGDKVTSDQHILAVLLLNLDTLKATMIGSSVYSGRNITNVVYSEENSGFYVFTKKADSEDVYVSFFNVIEKSFENVESKLLFETNTASEYYLYLYNTPSIQLLKDMNRKGNNGIFVMGSNAGGTIKTDRLLVFSIDRSNKNNPSINFLSEAYTLDTIHDEPYCNYAGNPIIYCERQTSTIYYLRPYYVPGKMYNTAGCFHRVTFDLERKMFVNEQNLENVISGLKSSMDDYCFIDCVMTCEGDSIYIIGGTQHKLVKVGTSVATRTRPQRLAVKINALLSNGFQEIEHSEEVINPFVTVKNILEVTPVNKGFQIYDESQNKPMWWNGESWETYPTASSEPSNPSEPDNSFETDWGTLGASELFKEDLSAPTFDIGDWTTTTLNGEPVIKSKKITSSQSTELTVTLTNITSLTVGLRASSESNYDKFYFHLNDEQMFYLTGDSTTKQETYADLDSSQSYKLKFVYTKDSSIDKFDDCGYITKIEYTQPSTSNEENNPIEVQMVRGHDSSVQSYTGKDGQLVYNQTTKRLHTMNGATRGGYPLALLSDVPTIPSTYDATKITLSSSNFTSSHVKGALDELFQSVDNGKTLIASAITDKGVETSKSDTFSKMAENILLIPTCNHENGTDQPEDGEEKIVITTKSVKEFFFNIFVAEGETCEVDWGDGVVEDVGSNTQLVSHSYVDSQKREITITGSKTKKTIYRIYFYKDGTSFANHNSSILTFHSEYVIFTDCKYMFAHAKYLTSVTMRGGYYRPSSTEWMFRFCSALIEVPDVIDLSDCTTATSMFDNAYKLEKCPDFIDCSKIVYAGSMFYYTPAMKSIKTLNLQSCLDIKQIFYGCGISAFPSDYNIPRAGRQISSNYTYRNMGNKANGYVVTVPNPIIMSTATSDGSFNKSQTSSTTTDLTGKMIIYISHDVVEEGIETDDENLQFQLSLSHMKNLTDLRIYNLKEYGNFMEEDGTWGDISDVIIGPLISVAHTGLDERALERLVSDLPTLHNVYGRLHTEGAVGYSRHANYIKEAQRKGWVTPFTKGEEDGIKEDAGVSIYVWFNHSSFGPDPNNYVEMALFSASNEYTVSSGSTTSDKKIYGRSGQFLRRDVNKSIRGCGMSISSSYPYKVLFRTSRHSFIEEFSSSNCVFTDCDQMFSGQLRLEKVTNGRTWVPRSAIEMFKGCTFIETLPSNLLDLSNCINTSSMFEGCEYLSTMQNRFDLASCENAEGMFSGSNRLAFSKDGEGMIISNLKTPIEIKDKPSIEKIVFESMENFSCTNQERLAGKVEIDLSNCGLDADALNDVLRSLNPGCVGNTIDVSGNPGALTCDTSLVSSSSWRVITTK